MFLAIGFIHILWPICIATLLIRAGEAWDTSFKLGALFTPLGLLVAGGMTLTGLPGNDLIRQLSLSLTQELLGFEYLAGYIVLTGIAGVVAGLLGKIKATELEFKPKAVASIILISSVVMAGALIPAPVEHSWKTVAIYTKQPEYKPFLLETGNFSVNGETFYLTVNQWINPSKPGVKKYKERFTENHVREGLEFYIKPPDQEKRFIGAYQINLSQVNQIKAKTKPSKEGAKFLNFTEVEEGKKYRFTPLPPLQFLHKELGLPQDRRQELENIVDHKILILEKSPDQVTFRVVDKNTTMTLNESIATKIRIPQ